MVAHADKDDLEDAEPVSANNLAGAAYETVLALGGSLRKGSVKIRGSEFALEEWLGELDRVEVICQEMGVLYTRGGPA